MCLMVLSLFWSKARGQSTALAGWGVPVFSLCCLFLCDHTWQMKSGHWEMCGVIVVSWTNTKQWQWHEILTPSPDYCSFSPSNGKKNGMFTEVFMVWTGHFSSEHRGGPAAGQNYRTRE